MKAAHGCVFKYGDNVDTDVIIPARYLNSSDPKELATHCMEDIDKDFVNRVQPGDIMVGGWNFGCGSSREHAPLCIKTAGIAVVIAKSFARIFYRNSINIGLPIMECPEAVDAIEAGDTVQVDFDTGVITDETKKRMQYQLKRIQDGSFAKEFMDDQAAGAPKFKKLQEEYSHPHLETVGPKLRAMFSWNNQVDADADMAESFNGKIARTQVQ